MLRKILPFFLLLLTFTLLTGCGGSGGTSGAPAISITPTTANAAAGQTAFFAALLKNSSDNVVWTVVGGSANGTVAADGTYTAPQVGGTYTVQAALQHNPSVHATAVVTVGGVVGISVAPFPTGGPVMIPFSQYQFVATVTNTSNTGVTWAVNNSPVNIGPDGTFTAPATGTYTIQARSNADPTKVATQSVTVVANATAIFNFAGKGAVVLSLRPDVAPKTSANLVTLLNKAFYNGIIVHRWVMNFVVQWGDPLTKTLPLTDPSIGSGGPGYTIPFENSGLSNVQYSLAMAHTSAGLDTAGSQIYINLVDNSATLDGQYCVFGAVQSGFDIVNELMVGDTITTATTAPATP